MGHNGSGASIGPAGDATEMPTLDGGDDAVRGRGDGEEATPVPAHASLLGTEEGGNIAPPMTLSNPVPIRQPRGTPNGDLNIADRTDPNSAGSTGSASGISPEKLKVPGSIGVGGSASVASSAGGLAGDLPSTASIMSAYSQREIPLITMTQFPQGYILHLGGVVKACSIKLCNNDEIGTRDAWWLELREELRSHAKVIEPPPPHTHTPRLMPSVHSVVGCWILCRREGISLFIGLVPEVIMGLLIPSVGLCRGHRNWGTRQWWDTPRRRPSTRGCVS